MDQRLHGEGRSARLQLLLLWVIERLTLSCCDSLPVLPTTAIFLTLFSHFFSN